MTPGAAPGVITISVMPDTPGTAFASLYAQHLPAARSAALSLVPAHAADDIAHEAFARVLAACRAGGGPRGEFRPYLLAVVRNLARDYTASQRRIAPVPLDPRAVAVPGAGELASRAEELRAVSRAFGALAPRHQAVLWQTEVEERTAGDLARACGMTPNAVAALALRARLALARSWQRERGDQERVTGAPRQLRNREIST